MRMPEHLIKPPVNASTVLRNAIAQLAVCETSLPTILVELIWH
jgi:hypothetical protein